MLETRHLFHRVSFAIFVSTNSQSLSHVANNINFYLPYPNIGMQGVCLEEQITSTVFTQFIDLLRTHEIAHSRTRACFLGEWPNYVIVTCLRYTRLGTFLAQRHSRVRMIYSSYMRFAQRVAYGHESYETIM